jgi:outer membrane protein TolC
VRTALIIFFLFSASILNAQQFDLSYYLKQAEEKSPLINKELNEKKIIQLDLRQVRAVLYKPDINIVSGMTLAPIISHDNTSNRLKLVSDGATDYIGHDLGLTDGGQFQAMVSLRQNLFQASRYKTYALKSGISDQISSNNIMLTRHELQQLVAYQYILCLFSNRKADISLSLIKDMNGQLNTLQRLVEKAVYKQTDLIILQIEVQNFQSEYENLKIEYLSNIYDLNLLCGINDTSEVKLKDTDFKISSALQGASTYLTSYHLDSLDIMGAQKISELKYKPQVEIFADAGLNAAYLPSLNRLGLTTGISFTWNIFDGHQRDIEREKSAIKLQELEFEKKNFFLQNEIQKSKALKQINALDQRIAQSARQAERYSQLYNSYTKELTLGDVSIMDFKNLIEDMASNKIEALQLQMERQIQINTYNYLNY